MNKKLIEEFFKTSHKFRALIMSFPNTKMEEKFATVLQFRALKYIEEHKEVMVGELAKELMLSSGAAAQLIERLTQNEWISRVEDKKDRRVARLLLTKNGKKELNAIKKRYMEHMQKMLSVIPEENIRELLDVFNKINKGLESKKNDKTT